MKAFGDSSKDYDNVYFNTYNYIAINIDICNPIAL